MHFRYYAKIIFKTIKWAAVLTGLILAMSRFIIWCASNIFFPHLSAGLWVKLIGLFVSILTIVKFHDIFLRYPFKKTFTARRIIDAPVEVVWEQVRPRARNEPYNAFHSSIRKVGDNQYRYFETNTGDAKKTFFDIKLTHEIPNQVLEIEYVDEDSPHDIVKTSCGMIYTFKSIGENRTEIKVTEVHKKPSLLTFYAFEFMGAFRDDFRQLASACEGQQNISWASAQIALDELASHPDATIADGLRSISDGALIAMTALITAIIMIFVWLI